MFRSNKHSFWEALIITIFIFGIGILFGIFLEQSRATTISDMYLKSEVNLLDVKIQTELLNMQDIDCASALEENIKFGDAIYSDAKQLDYYEKASRLTEALLEQHKRYDLLRTLFWVNSIKIKSKCNSNFHNLVYLYNYHTENLEENNKQKTFSNFLMELKNEYGNHVILIPIAMDLNLTSIDYMANQYKINQTSIILDEKNIFSSVEELPKLKELIATEKD